MIAEKLAAIQAELKAPKSQYNSFGKYNYRSCEDILEAVKPLLQKHQAAVTLSDEVVSVGDRIYIKAKATLKDSESEISVTAYAREDETKKGMDGSQITGSASSYARKYALNGLFAIDDTKDADSNGKSEPPKKELPAIGEAEKAEVLIRGEAYKLGDLKLSTLRYLEEHNTDERLKECLQVVIADKTRKEADSEPAPWD